MKQIILTMCALAGLVGSTSFGGTCVQTVETRCLRPVRERVCVRVVEADPCLKPLPKQPCCYDSFREPYRISYPRLCPEVGETVEVGNTPGAMAMRRAAVLRQRENENFERELLAASGPSPQAAVGTTFFGSTEGAGVYNNGNEPIPCAPSYLGTQTRVSPPCPTPAPVRECVPPVVAVPVPCKPGYVYCPFSREGGYVDVRRFAPGSLVRDPYTGRPFRVP